MGKPAKPGTTPSLPGAMSSRTDGPGSVASKQAIRYAAGEPGAEDFVNLQRQAALNKFPDVKGMAPSQIEAAAAQNNDQSMPTTQLSNPVQAIPLGAQSAYPDQHVTDTSGVVLPSQVSGQYQDAHQMFQSMAADPNSSPAMKYLAMRIGQGF